MFLLYHFEREVAPAVKKADWEKRPFGAHMDVAKMVALQVAWQNSCRALLAVAVCFEGCWLGCAATSCLGVP